MHATLSTSLVHLIALLTSARPAERPTLVAESLQGEEKRADLAAATASEALALGAVFLRVEGMPTPSLPDPRDEGHVLVRMPSGERVSGRLVGGGSDALELELAGGARLSLDVEELARVELPARLAAGEGSEAVEPPPEGDRLYRRRGSGLDRIDGLVHALEIDGVRFESQLGERVFPWTELAALFVDPLEGDAAQVPEGTGVRRVALDLHGGTRLFGELLALDVRTLTMRRGRGAELVLPTALLLELAVLDDRYAFLSELEPSDLGPLGPFSDPASGTSETSDARDSGGGDELGMVWPPRFDSAQSGGPLRAGGRVWARGIGVHAPSRLTWPLGGAYSRLRLSAAVDDEVLGREGGGSVVFAIAVDGESRYRSPVVLAGHDPLLVPPIDLQGARELTLSVEIADDSFALDRADWLRPILVRSP